MTITYTPNKTAKIILSIVLVILIVIAYKKRKSLSSLVMQSINFLKEKTWDIITDRRIDTLHPLIRAKVKEFIIRAQKDLGIKLRVTSALRTWEEQTRLYNKGRSAPGKRVTNAKAGESYHNYGLAFDVVEIKNGRAIWNNPNWQKIGALGKSLGFEWGGDWTRLVDKPHFQMRFGKHHRELSIMYTSGQRQGRFVNLPKYKEVN
ncbi:M15 family metallopeptidase [Aquimarina algiphila]|uniref:M15 family metallopeptidase n=1 Tax=Aquimarina algiphila TaxID=2047982 RepID=A0A554VNN9_9FLAO|nr:M15 family metallopeptidase [Aquimarina algiphila]TSE09998.1 M15 family metallopeptidase [Aquimarina algiphila]